MRCSPEQPVIRLLGGQQRYVCLRWQRVGQTGTEAGEVETEHRERAADRIQVGSDRRTDRRQLRRLVPGRAVQRRLVVVHPAYGAEVDELQLLFGVDDVIRLEVAEEQVAIMQIAERRQHLDAVRQDLWQRQRLASTVRAAMC